MRVEAPSDGHPVDARRTAVVEAAVLTRRRPLTDEEMHKPLKAEKHYKMKRALNKQAEKDKAEIFEI